MARRATRSDIVQIANLYHSIWHETHSAFMPGPEVARRTTTFFVDRMTILQPATLVEERGGSIAGFASWAGCLLGQFYVAPPFRGSGLASKLLRATERAMADEGIVEAELHCITGNNRARRFYERQEWKFKGSIMEDVAGYDGEIGIEFWQMTKVLR